MYERFDTHRFEMHSCVCRCFDDRGVFPLWLTDDPLGSRIGKVKVMKDWSDGVEVSEDLTLTMQQIAYILDEGLYQAWIHGMDREPLDPRNNDGRDSKFCIVATSAEIKREQYTGHIYTIFQIPWSRSTNEYQNWVNGNIDIAAANMSSERSEVSN